MEILALDLEDNQLPFPLILLQAKAGGLKKVKLTS